MGRLAGSGSAGGVDWLRTSPLALPIGVVLTEVGAPSRSLVPCLPPSSWLVPARRGPVSAAPGKGPCYRDWRGSRAAMVAVSDVLGQLLQHLGLDQSGQYKQLIVPLQNAPSWIILLTIILGTFLAPVIEELFFRGYIFRSLRATKGAVVAYAISASPSPPFTCCPSSFPSSWPRGARLRLRTRRKHADKYHGTCSE